MTVKLSSVLVDVDKEASGEWQPSLKWDGVEYLVRSLHYPPYLTELQLLNQKFSRRRTVPLAERSVEEGKLLHKHILLDWRGFDEPYTKERAKEIFSGPQGREFATDVQNAALMVAQIVAEFVEDAAKNSERPSAID